MADDNNDIPVGALNGVRVVDLSRLVAGNMVSHMLADFGADVIKIERPGVGDDLRNWREDGVEIFWKAYSRNKRSVCWDLKSDEDKAKLLQLVETAHVFIENFVPGKLEEFGLGPDVLFEANPNLIIVRVSGWGQTGPYRERPGFGTLIEGMSGYAHLNGFPDKPPALPPLATADMIAGLYGAYAVMAGAAPRRDAGRPRSGHRPLALRQHVLVCRLGSGQVSGLGPGQHARRQPGPAHRPAQRLPLRRRQVHRPLGLHAAHVRTPADGHRTPGTDRRSPLPHQ